MTSKKDAVDTNLEQFDVVASAELPASRSPENREVIHIIIKKNHGYHHLEPK